MKMLILLLLSTFIFGWAPAQSLSPISQNNLSGIYGTIGNPAAGAGGIDRFSFNLVGAGAEIQNNALRSDVDYDYFRVTSKRPLMIEPGSLDKVSYNAPRKWVLKPKIYSNLDVLQLGIQAAINKRITLFAFSRERAISNFDKSDYASLKFIIDEEYNHKEDKIKLIFDARSISYQELGVGGAFEVYNKRKTYVKAGFTYKLLNGRAAYAASVSNFESKIENNKIRVSSQMDLIETSLDLITQNPLDFLLKPKIGRGQSFDFGVVYEHRPYSRKHTYRKNNPKTKNKHFNERNKIKYDFKIGISLLDVGSISYKSEAVSYKNYSIDALYDPLDLSIMTSDDYIESLSDSAKQTLVNSPIRFNLPTTLNINYDVALLKNWFFSVNYSQNMVKNAFKSIYSPTRILLQARKETNSCVYGFPLQIVPGTRTINIGANVQAGPFFVGTNNIGTLFLRKIYNPSFYLGLFYNIRYKKDDTLENHRSFRTKRKRIYNWSGF